MAYTYIANFSGVGGGTWTVLSQVCVFSVVCTVNREPIDSWIREEIISGRKKQIVEEWKTNLLSLAILFHFLCAQHVSDINISIIMSLRLCCWITTSVVLFSFRCVLEIWCGWFWVVLVLQAEAHVVINQHSRKLLIMDILMSKTCWARKKCNKIASDIKLVFHSSTITMMHGPINMREIQMLNFDYGHFSFFLWRLLRNLTKLILTLSSLTVISIAGFNPLNIELNPICHLLALLGAHLIFHVSGIRVNWPNDILMKLPIVVTEGKIH